MFVFYAAKTINKKYFLAIALHSLIDVLAAYNQHLTTGNLPMAALEIIILAYSIAAAIFARRIYLILPHTERAGVKKKDWEYARTKYKDKEDEENGSKTL